MTQAVGTTFYVLTGLGLLTTTFALFRACVQEKLSASATVIAAFFGVTAYVFSLYLLGSPATNGDGGICMEDSAFGLFTHPERNVMLPAYEGLWSCEVAQATRAIAAILISLGFTAITLYATTRKPQRELTNR